MKILAEPSYKRFIRSELRRFDERNTGFSRGVVEGDKYTLMHENSVRNIEKLIPGKTIIDHASWVAGRTVDYILRKKVLAREGGPIYNTRYRLEDPDPHAMTRIIKGVALWLGADLVGIAKLNRLWIYSHWGEHNAMYTNAARPGEPIDIPAEYDKVIVMIHEMDYERIHRTPAVESETDIAYSRMGWCASSLATFIRELGYLAIPCGNELGLSIPMAIDAGLGELGRMGLLMTREFGPRVRISKVFTDLPLVPDSPIEIGVQRFCEKCSLCAKHCPSHAIMSGPRTDKPWDQSNSTGVLKWPIRAMDCLNWWVANGTHCSICIRVCPWNKPRTLFHRSVRVLAERDLFTRILVLCDQLLGYGKQARGKGFMSIQEPSIKRLSSTDTRHQIPKAYV